MTKTKKIIITAMVLVIIAFLVAIVIQLNSKEKPFKPSPTLFANVPHVSENNITSTPKATSIIVPNTSPPVPSVSQVPAIDDYFAKITISTDKKTRTFDVMPDVDKDTLKNNIGWLPSSSMPGKKGTCILMGHRDTDFKILKYCVVGNEITMQVKNSTIRYSVIKIQIIDSNELLKFESNPQDTLLLMTCYPFYYSGHAPQKILFYCTKS